MIYNLENYRHTVAPVIQTWLNNKSTTILEEIGPISLSTSCPLVVVCYLVGELHGFSPELLDKIRKLEDYYQVEEIVGKL